MGRRMYFLCLLLISITGLAQEVDAIVKIDIRQQLHRLKTAHLNSDIPLASAIYHSQLMLTSQSGKKYARDTVLINLKNTFEQYESSAIEFLKVTDDVVLTNYINERKYKGFDKSKFRLTAVWTTYKKEWRIIAMQSSKIKD